MANHQILFDKLAFIDRLKGAEFTEPQARAIGEALDDALRESLVTKADLDVTTAALKADIARLDHKIDLAVRDMTIRTGAMLIALFSALVALRAVGMPR
jgi:hypothetical protein